MCGRCDYFKEKMKNYNYCPYCGKPLKKYCFVPDVIGYGKTSAPEPSRNRKFRYIE